LLDSDNDNDDDNYDYTSLVLSLLSASISLFSGVADYNNDYNGNIATTVGTVSKKCKGSSVLLVSCPARTQF